MPRTFEPFRIKAVEPIRLNSPTERADFLAAAGYNLFNLPSSAVLIDLLSDSGTGAMSAAQWAALMDGDEAYAGGRSFERFEAAVQDIFGFSEVIPTHQGRAAERILATTLCQPGDVVPNNTHFDTTRANFEAVGAAAVDLPCRQARDIDQPHRFKGDIDLEALDQVLDEHRGRVPLVMLTVTNNGGGGQPVSMANLQAASKLVRSYGVPLYLDACRFAENAYLIQQRTPRYAGETLIGIARQMFALADGCTMSAKKDGMVNIGGFLCTRDQRVAARFKELLILSEGFPTYGGLAGRDLECIAVGLYEALDPDYQRYRHAMASALGDSLRAAGVPIVEPPGGHAIYVDARRMLPHLGPEDYPGQAMVIELYRHAGIRSVEIGSVMFGRPDPATGKETYADRDLVRLAFPRRVYTGGHMEYVAESIGEVASHSHRIPGVRIATQPRALRHFSATFELLAPNQRRQRVSA